MLQNVFGVGLVIAAVGDVRRCSTRARAIAGERKRVTAMIPLFIGGVAFFMVFEQASTTMSLFAERLVHREYLGMHVVVERLPVHQRRLHPAARAGVRVRCGRRLAQGRQGAVERQQVRDRHGVHDAVVRRHAADAVARSRRSISVQARATCGRVPVPHGQSRTTSSCSTRSRRAPSCASRRSGCRACRKLAPQRLAGMVMGTWFLATAIGNYLAGRAAQLSAANGYGFLFWLLIIASLIIAAALFAVAPVIKRMLSGEPRCRCRPRRSSTRRRWSCEVPDADPRVRSPRATRTSPIRRRSPPPRPSARRSSSTSSTISPRRQGQGSRDGRRRAADRGSPGVRRDRARDSRVHGQGARSRGGQEVSAQRRGPRVHDQGVGRAR